MRWIEILRSRNRTLLEIHLGIAFWTVAATVAGAVLPMGRWGLARMTYFSGLWTAAFLAAVAVVHMHRCLDTGLDFDQKTATRIIYRGYLIRYTALAVIAVVTTLAGILNPVVLCLGYLLLMKVAVYSQPFTHKLCNKLFHETDPEPEPLSDEELKEWDKKYN